ncbi:MAG: PhoH family protein [bacterium]
MQRKFTLKSTDPLALLGSRDSNLRLIRESFDAKIVVRGDTLLLEGEPSELKQLEKLFSELTAVISRNGGLTQSDIETLVHLLKNEKPVAKSLPSDQVIVHGRKESVRPRTEGQKRYYNSVLMNDIVFCIGPAGTGKTYIAVAMAVGQLQAHNVDRIFLARPAVEAGEKLGYLPGDFREKVDPYLRPLYDALNDMMPADKLRKMMEQGTIEILPLAYMRGRTFNNAFVILDEAQNTSANQMKMFLTRLGVHSKAIVTGDITQIDLPEKHASGLVQIQQVLDKVKGIAFIYLDEKDVVRHRLVREIILAYDHFDEKQRKEQDDRLSGEEGKSPEDEHE